MPYSRISDDTVSTSVSSTTTKLNTAMAVVRDGRPPLPSASGSAHPGRGAEFASFGDTTNRVTPRRLSSVGG
jgi:hypothetical protein